MAKFTGVVPCVDLKEQATMDEFCGELFSSFGRSDQRRWGQAYVRGLLWVPGRKSIRRISELVVGHDAEQALQQFVNQSPWEWGPVRRALAERIGRGFRPRAWVIKEVVFPKNGGSSVGVTRQYAPAAGRVLNCQRAFAIFLAGDGDSCPVSWRLLLPEEWDQDAERRAKCRVPDEERFRPPWQSVLEALDELLEHWRMPRVPVVVELGGQSEGDALLRGLESRGLQYLVQVAASTPALPAGPVAQSDPAKPLPTVGRLAALAARRSRATLSWSVKDRMVSSQFAFAAVPRFPVIGDAPPVLSVSRRVLADWPWRHVRPRTVWLTNLQAAGVAETVSLLRARDQVAGDLERLTAESGLRHFEGRSYPGWHHHVTLVSVAHGYRMITETHPVEDDQPRRTGTAAL